MLSTKGLEAIATRPNRAVGLPILKEETEQAVLVKIVKLSDRRLYSVPSNEIYGLLKAASDGISEQDAAPSKRTDDARQADGRSAVPERSDGGDGLPRRHRDDRPRNDHGAVDRRRPGHDSARGAVDGNTTGVPSIGWRTIVTVAP